MNQYYPHLFEPLTIGKTTFRNRIFSAPNAGWNYPNGRVSESEIAYFAEKAKGGAAQVTVGETPVTWKYIPEGADFVINLHDRSNLPALTELATVINMYGAVSSIELSHPGQYAHVATQGDNETVGPMGFVRARDGMVVKEMDEAMIEEAIEDFARSAEIVKLAGFQMAMVHAAHGWLPAQFLSKHYNHRTDRWGGSLENRSRFIIEVLKRIRDRVGPDFLLELRISGDELIEDGMHIEEVVAFCKIAEDYADLFHISAGLHEEMEYRYRLFAVTKYTQHGCNADLAAAVKRAISKPVVTVGGYTTPELAEQVLAEGKADVVAMARSLMADPYFPQKARAGKADEIIACMRCLDCCAGLSKNHMLACSANPVTGHEMRCYGVPVPRESKKVVVIGGGPAGMQAAITASARGHKVVLMEKSDVLGGQLRYADCDKMYDDMRAFRDYLIRTTLKTAEVRLNQTATAELVEKEKPDAVIVAVGAKPTKLNIPGAEQENVFSAIDAYYSMDKTGDTVAIIGGGMVGCEMSLMLAKKGKKVTILELTDYIGDRENLKIHRPTLAAMEAEPNITMVRMARCDRIAGNVLYYTVADEGEKQLAVDTVLYSIGMTPLREEAEVFRYTAPDVKVIADCNRPGKVRQATCTGYFAAMDIM